MKRTRAEVASLDARAVRLPLSQCLARVHPLNPMLRVIPVVVAQLGEYRCILDGKPVIVVPDTP